MPDLVNIGPRQEARTCGECTLCCKLLGIPVIDKKPGVWCPECAIGYGCKIYSRRPAACHNFECLWLQSDAPDEYRPDRLKAVIGFTKDGETPVVYVDPATPDQWQQGRLARLIEQLRQSFPVIIHYGSRRKLLPKIGDPGEILDAEMP